MITDDYPLMKFWNQLSFIRENAEREKREMDKASRRRR